MPAIASQISLYVMAAQSILLLASFLDPRARPWLGNVFSYLVLLGLEIIVIVLAAQECPVPSRGLLVLLKTLLFLACFLRFHRDLRYDVGRMTFSIVVMGLYCAFTDLDRVYGCELQRSSLALSFVASSLVYCLLAFSRA